MTIEQAGQQAGARAAPASHPAPDPSAATPAVPMVAFQATGKRYGPAGEGGFTAVEHVDLTVARGAITGIIGRSGAGKSTLIRMVNGLETATSGKVLVDGVDVGALGEDGLRGLRRQIGMIFQHFNLLSSRTAFDNVALPLEIAGVDRQAIRAKVGPLLDLVGLGDKAGSYPSELSGGQKQRVGIARALATDPKLLLSDEATSALDPETTQSILELLKRINADLGLTVLLITHEMEVVKTIASHVAVIDAGRIVEAGRTFDVYTNPQHETTRTLLAASLKLPQWLRSTIKPQPSRRRPHAGAAGVLRRHRLQAADRAAGRRTRFRRQHPCRRDRGDRRRTLRLARRLLFGRSRGRGACQPLLCRNRPDHGGARLCRLR
jgi:D-methionine transport system ATP-binding protein